MTLRLGIAISGGGCGSGSGLVGSAPRTITPIRGPRGGPYTKPFLENRAEPPPQPSPARTRRREKNAHPLATPRRPPFVPLRLRGSGRPPRLSGLRRLKPPLRRRIERSAYTLIEMLTTVAALVIVLGMMVSLARYVRYRSSTELTRDLLAQLDAGMAQYMRDHDGARPAIPAAFDDRTGEEGGDVRANNIAFVRLLRGRQPPSGGLFTNLPVSMFDQTVLRDTWGSLIVYMPHQNPAIGMAPDDRPFFFSAGPDRRYLTRDDNLYSYESVGVRAKP